MLSITIQKKILITIVSCIVLHAVSEANAEGSISTLEQVWNKVEHGNPMLKRNAHLVSSSKQLISKANTIPNPKLSAEIENYGGDYDGNERAEQTISLVQEIELGSKRGARKDVAVANNQIAVQQAIIERFAIFAETKRAYSDVLFAQGLVALAQERLKTSRVLLKEVVRKVEAGAVLPVEKAKASINLQKQELSLQQAQAKLAVDKKKLVSLWGGVVDELGMLRKVDIANGVEKYRENVDIESLPAFVLAQLHQQEAKARLGIETSMAYPDIEVGVGYRRLEENEVDTYLASVSMDLPIFNLNSAGISSAKQEVMAKKFEVDALRRNLEQKLFELQSQLKMYMKNQKSLETTVVEQSDRAFKQAHRAYRSGKMSYLEFADAQNSLFESRQMLLENLHSLAVTVSELDELIGLDGGVR